MMKKEVRENIWCWGRATALAGALVMAMSAYAQAQETPDSAYISGWNLQGTGCSNQNSDVTISPDYKDISVLYGDYRLETGAGTSRDRQQRASVNCILDFNVVAPYGWRFAFRRAEFRGFVSLPNGVQGLGQFAYAHSDGSGRPPSLREVKYTGSTSRDFTEYSEVSPGNESWSRCGGTMKVRLQSALRITYPLSDRRFETAMFQMDSTDATLQHLQIVWQRCR